MSTLLQRGVLGMLLAADGVGERGKLMGVLKCADGIGPEGPDVAS